MTDSFKSGITLALQKIQYFPQIPLSTIGMGDAFEMSFKVVEKICSGIFPSEYVQVLILKQRSRRGYGLTDRPGGICQVGGICLHPFHWYHKDKPKHDCPFAAFSPFG